MLLEKQTQTIQGPLNITYNQIKLLISKLEINKGILNLIQRSIDYTEWKEIAMPQSQIKEQQEEEKDEEFEEKLDKVNELKSCNYEPLNKYLAQLTQQIEMALLPIPKKLVSFERAIAILISLIPKIDKSNQQQFLMAKLEFARANRYLALQQEELKELWLRQGEVLQNESQILKPKIEDDYQELGFNVDYQLQSFQCIQEIIENEEFKQLVDNVLITPHAFYNSTIFAEEVIENFGNKYPETTIEFLFKYQHFKNIEMFKKILKKSASSDYKPHLLLKMNKFILNNYLTIQNQDIENQLKNFKVWSQVYQTPDYKEIIREILPINSAYLTISLSPNKQAIYIGFMMINKKRETIIELFKRQLNKGDWDLLAKLIQGMNKIKQVLIKTPIITNDEHRKLEEEQDLAYQVLFSEFEEFCKFFTPVLDKIINSPLEEAEQNQEDQQQIGGKKPVPAAAAKKKGQKDELPAYDSPLKSTLSGIDNLVILMDHELMTLPFEFLYPFNEIPAKSRDFSLSLLAKRYKNIQFNSQLNNSIGIQRDKMKYVIYDFKQLEENQMMEINIASSIESGMKPGGNFSNLKFQGNTTSQRIASIGEWQRYLSSASGLLFYGHPSILEILSPKLFTDLLEINETKAFMVFDRINAIKTMIEKQSSLDPNSDKIPVVEQPLMTLVLLSLLGASTIAINQWSIHPVETATTVKSILGSINQQIYFAAALNQYKQPQIVYLDKDGNIVDVSTQEKDQKKPPSQSKKGPKLQPQQAEDQIELKKEEQFKKLLYLHHAIFMGVPIIRLS